MGRKLGSGSFGAILLGTDLSTGKYVAIKFVSRVYSDKTCAGKNLNQQIGDVTIGSQNHEEFTLRRWNFEI